MSDSNHYCPSHPNPLCPMKEKKGKCELCGFDHGKPSLSREDLRVRWDAAKAKGQEALARHEEAENDQKREKALERKEKNRQKKEENKRSEAEDQDWAAAMKADTEESYSTYLARYPGGKYKEAAEKQIEELKAKAKRMAVNWRREAEERENAEKVRKEETAQRSAQSTQSRKKTQTTNKSFKTAEKPDSAANSWWIWVVSGMVLFVFVFALYPQKKPEEMRSNMATTTPRQHQPSRDLITPASPKTEGSLSDSVSKPADSAVSMAQAAQNVYPKVKVFRDCEEVWCPKMVVIPPGALIMGSYDKDEEKPTHAVYMKQFALGQTEVTQGQWKGLMGNNPSYFKDCGDDCPVEQVNWNDAKAFIEKLNDKMEIIGKGRPYRLPSEAEWEYAARAGVTTPFTTGNSINADQANFSSEKTMKVGSFNANAFGLYDIHGNVYEWVEDCWNNNYEGAPSDGKAWLTDGGCDVRVKRGGAWVSAAEKLRITSRDWSSQYISSGERISPEGKKKKSLRTNHLGFRVARTL